LANTRQSGQWRGKSFIGGGHKRALVQTLGINETKRSETLCGSSGENCIPNFGCHFVFNAKLSEFELTFPDPMGEFNAGDGDRGAPKALQSKHWTQTKFDRSMVLFDQIVQIFRGPYLGPLAVPMLAEDFPRRPMRLVTIKRDGARQPALGAGFGRWSLLAFFQFPFSGRGDGFGCFQRPVRGTPVSGTRGRNEAAGSLIY
jgi:hypothetical protein